MKIENISNINLVFTIKNNKNITERAYLNPGESIVVNNDFIGSQLRVYKQKKMVKITDVISQEIVIDETKSMQENIIILETKTEEPNQISDSSTSNEIKKKRGRPFGTIKNPPKEKIEGKKRGRPFGSVKTNKDPFKIAEENVEKYIKGDDLVSNNNLEEEKENNDDY